MPEHHHRAVLPGVATIWLQQQPGINNNDLLKAVWYRRTVNASADFAGNCVLLHFQAADYATSTQAIGGRRWQRMGAGHAPASAA